MTMAATAEPRKESIPLHNENRFTRTRYNYNILNFVMHIIFSEYRVLFLAISYLRSFPRRHVWVKPKYPVPLLGLAS
jgi:hypothetical protein